MNESTLPDSATQTLLAWSGVFTAILTGVLALVGLITSWDKLKDALSRARAPRVSRVDGASVDGSLP